MKAVDIGSALLNTKAIERVLGLDIKINVDEL